SWTATVPHAADWFALHFTSVEVNEGMKSFVEKRPTDYMKLRTLAAEGKSSEYVWGPYSLNCPNCGAKDMPAEFKHCGVCGAKLVG
ncbi:MAG: hypothetical protein M1358_06180, partial [Chloroflexi bacterium]|nr:hypothetical protein [Chloroflexota bacterium]